MHESGSGSEGGPDQCGLFEPVAGEVSDGRGRAGVAAGIERLAAEDLLKSRRDVAPGAMFWDSSWHHTRTAPSYLSTSSARRFRWSG